MKPNVLYVATAFFAVALGQALPKISEQDVLHSFFCGQETGRLVLEDTSFSFKHLFWTYEFLLTIGSLNLPNGGKLHGTCNTLFAPKQTNYAPVYCTFDLSGSVGYYDVTKKNSWRFRNSDFRISATVKKGNFRVSVKFNRLEDRKNQEAVVTVKVDPLSLDIRHPAGVSLLNKVEKKFVEHAKTRISQTIEKALQSACKGREKWFLKMFLNYTLQTSTRIPTTTTKRKSLSTKTTTTVQTSTSTPRSYPTELFPTRVSSTVQANSPVAKTYSTNAKDFTDATNTNTIEKKQRADYATTQPEKSWSIMSSFPENEKTSTATTRTSKKQTRTNDTHGSLHPTKTTKTVLKTDMTSSLEPNNTSTDKQSPTTKIVPPKEITNKPTGQKPNNKSTTSQVIGSTTKSETTKIENYITSTSTSWVIGKTNNKTSAKSDSENSTTQDASKTNGAQSIPARNKRSTATYFSTKTEHTSNIPPKSGPITESSNTMARISTNNNSTHIALTTNPITQQENTTPTTSTISSATVYNAAQSDDSSTVPTEYNSSSSAAISDSHSADDSIIATKTKTLQPIKPEKTRTTDQQKNTMTTTTLSSRTPSSVSPPTNSTFGAVLSTSTIENTTTASERASTNGIGKANGPESSNETVRGSISSNVTTEGEESTSLRSKEAHRIKTSTQAISSDTAIPTNPQTASNATSQQTTTKTTTPNTPGMTTASITTQMNTTSSAIRRRSTEETSSDRVSLNTINKGTSTIAITNAPQINDEREHASFTRYSAPQSEGQPSVPPSRSHRDDNSSNVTESTTREPITKQIRTETTDQQRTTTSIKTSRAIMTTPSIAAQTNSPTSTVISSSTIGPYTHLQDITTASEHTSTNEEDKANGLESSNQTVGGSISSSVATDPGESTSLSSNDSHGTKSTSREISSESAKSTTAETTNITTSKQMTTTTTTTTTGMSPKSSKTQNINNSNVVSNSSTGGTSSDRESQTTTNERKSTTAIAKTDAPQSNNGSADGSFPQYSVPEREGQSSLAPSRSHTADHFSNVTESTSLQPNTTETTKITTTTTTSRTSMTTPFVAARTNSASSTVISSSTIGPSTNFEDITTASERTSMNGVDKVNSQDSSNETVGGSITPSFTTEAGESTSVSSKDSHGTESSTQAITSETVKPTTAKTTNYTTSRNNNQNHYHHNNISRKHDNAIGCSTNEQHIKYGDKQFYNRGFHSF
ncbi:mucin-5AC-like [Dermacentor silvarum]|uniref:mucin-5AC-like n=1 Tax=Dermacentor silvarum TaxID=543639 RepID=UPI0021016243|nr:mucin-5AC-like [Dermacentor silvarum]